MGRPRKYDNSEPTVLPRGALQLLKAAMFQLRPAEAAFVSQR